MDIIHPEIDGYLDRTLASNDPLLREIKAYGREREFPIIGLQVNKRPSASARGHEMDPVADERAGFFRDDCASTRWRRGRIPDSTGG